MSFVRVSFALPALVAVAFLACAQPGAELADLTEDELNAVGEGDLAAAAWSSTTGTTGGATTGWGTTGGATGGGTTWGGTTGGGNRKWTPRYAEAVATAQAFAENGSTAEATATAFIGTLKKNGYWKTACAANAIAVAEAVAIDSCTGAITVARAVASVTC